MDHELEADLNEVIESRSPMHLRPSEQRALSMALRFDESINQTQETEYDDNVPVNDPLITGAMNASLNSKENDNDYEYKEDVEGQNESGRTTISGQLSEDVMVNIQNEKSSAPTTVDVNGRYSEKMTSHQVLTLNKMDKRIIHQRKKSRQISS